MRLATAWCIVLFALVCLAHAADPSWEFACGGASALFPPGATRADLVRHFGAANVKDKHIPNEDGGTDPGVVIYDSNASRRVWITWADARRKAGLRTVEIFGESGASAWHTCEGITLGTDLRTIEKLNGRAFALHGFGWDYAGTVSDWQDGKLNRYQRVFFRLGPDNAVALSEYADVMGDGAFPSSHPTMQRLNPRVYAMGLWYAD